MAQSSTHHESETERKPSFQVTLLQILFRNSWVIQ